MKRDDLMKDIERNIGSFPNVSQIAKHLGWSRDRVRAMMADVEYIGGNPKQYYAGDIADKIMAMRAM